MKDPDWLLDSTPRPVQMEALRRSYGGFKTQDTLDDQCKVSRLRDGPARGWSHYLEMRLGKSSLLINEFELFARDHGIKRMVIVCPNSFKIGWIKEAEQSGTLTPWTAWESTKPHIADKVIKEAEDGWVLVINYEALKSDKTQEYLKKWLGHHKYGLGIDESIKIKNHSSQQTKWVMALAKTASFVRNLSGKSVVAGPQDLYPQFRAIGQQNGVKFWAFRNRFCKMGGYKNKKVVGTKNEEELQGLLERSAFIARKRDWGREGEKEYVQEPVAITDKQKKHYQEMDKDFVTYLDSGQEITADVVISKMMKLTQISSGFVYHEGKPLYFEDPLKVPKMQRLMDIMEELHGKIVVCYHYSATGDSLLEALKAYNPTIIRSQMWMKKNGVDVEGQKAIFNNSPDCRVMIAQITASKYGHTLIGGPDDDRCETMAFYESTYSLDDRSQVEMRNTYYDQDWSNLYLDFVGTKAEANIAKNLAAKNKISDSIIDLYKTEGTGL